MSTIEFRELHHQDRELHHQDCGLHPKPGYPCLLQQANSLPPPPTSQVNLRPHAPQVPLHLWPATRHQHRTSQSAACSSAVLPVCPTASTHSRRQAPTVSYVPATATARTHSSGQCAPTTSKYGSSLHHAAYHVRPTTPRARSLPQWPPRQQTPAHHAASPTTCNLLSYVQAATSSPFALKQRAPTACAWTRMLRHALTTAEPPPSSSYRACRAAERQRLLPLNSRPC